MCMTCGGASNQHAKVGKYTPKNVPSPLTRNTSKPARRMTHSNTGTFGVPTIKTNGFKIGR